MFESVFFSVFFLVGSRDELLDGEVKVGDEDEGEQDEPVNLFQ